MCQLYETEIRARPWACFQGKGAKRANGPRRARWHMSGGAFYAIEAEDGVMSAGCSEASQRPSPRAARTNNPAPISTEA